MFPGPKKMRCERHEGHATATKRVTVNYDGMDDIDELILCDRCADFVKKDAESHGYKVKVNEFKE